MILSLCSSLYLLMMLEKDEQKLTCVICITFFVVDDGFSGGTMQHVLELPRRQLPPRQHPPLDCTILVSIICLASNLISFDVMYIFLTTFIPDVSCTADWLNTDEVCRNDNGQPSYMTGNPSLWMHSTLAACSTTNYS